MLLSTIYLILVFVSLPYFLLSNWYNHPFGELLYWFRGWAHLLQG
uniref:Uncharacterized protein n=1 Tax=Rhizophora mucronata TaxID=61149 RepID=A0A2P2MQ62_RHIMU